MQSLMGETPKTALHRSNALQLNVVSIINNNVPSSNKYRQA
ncbi:hypothetical protein [Moorena producens]|nr:hypothetical protein [Moorena producens]